MFTRVWTLQGVHRILVTFILFKIFRFIQTHFSIFNYWKFPIQNEWRKSLNCLQSFTFSSFHFFVHSPRSVIHMHVRMQVHIHTHTNKYTHSYMHTQSRKNTKADTQTYLWLICMHMHKCTCARLFSCANHIHTHTHRDLKTSRCGQTDPLTYAHTHKLCPSNH